jgi:hypothetical protein
MPVPMVALATVEWCVQRDHPFVTYNPWLDESFCRCGARQVPGEQPMDWQAKRVVFHACGSDESGECRCYVGPPAARMKEAS